MKARRRIEQCDKFFGIPFVGVYFIDSDSLATSRIRLNIGKQVLNS